MNKNHRKLALSIQATTLPTNITKKVIEIAITEFLDNKLGTRRFHAYLNPQRPLDSWDVLETGLSDDFLADKPCFSEIVAEMLDFIKDAQVYAYDPETVLLLNEELRHAGMPSLNQCSAAVVDLLALANELFPSFENSLSSLCRRYFINAEQGAFFGALRQSDQLAGLAIRMRSRNISRAFAQQDKSVRVTISSFGQFMHEIDGISRTCLCRGVSDKDFLLWPSLFRFPFKPYGQRNPDDVERNLMWMFKTHAAGILGQAPSSEIEWLTIGQHHGLPTRLLDWSLSPLVAAFFAVESLSSADGAVFLLEIGSFKRAEEIDLPNLSEIVAFFPSHSSRRISAQSGMFTIHPTSKPTLDSSGLKQIIIPAKCKRDIKEKLFKLGIHKATLFPDLDGLSSHLKYLNEF